jgi:hypothetical protein
MYFYFRAVLFPYIKGNLSNITNIAAAEIINNNSSSSSNFAFAGAYVCDYPNICHVMVTTSPSSSSDSVPLRI